MPQPVRDAVRLDRLEALEVEQRLRVPFARGVAVKDGLQVGDAGVQDVLLVACVRVRCASCVMCRVSIMRACVYA